MGALQPDYTLFIQIATFVALWQFLKWALFAPVGRALAARAARTTGDKTRAQELRAQAEATLAEIEAGLAEARQQGAREADAIRRHAEGEEQKTLGRYRDEALQILERGRADTRAQVDAARAPLRSEAERLAAKVVEKVLGRAA
jgi:F-type H+-transporting ATPase subunit b